MALVGEPDISCWPGGGSLRGVADAFAETPTNGQREQLPGVDILYLKNVLLKFLDSAAAGRTEQVRRHCASSNSYQTLFRNWGIKRRASVWRIAGQLVLESQRKYEHERLQNSHASNYWLQIAACHALLAGTLQKSGKACKGGLGRHNSELFKTRRFAPKSSLSVEPRCACAV